jgi:hypothetical protein
MSVEHAVGTRDLLDGYAGEFSDGTPKGWATSRDGRGYAFTLPNGALIHSEELSDESIWNQVPQSDPNTTILWRNSLAYLVRLFEFEQSTNSIETARVVVESFLHWAEAASTKDPKSMKSGSLDHQGALRIRTLMSLMSMISRTGDAENFEVFHGLFERLIMVEERLLDQLDLYQPNNHGIMLGMAHLHASTLFPSNAKLHDSGEWIERLYDTLGHIIDEDGIASENTPIYQVFYVSLIEDIVAFLVWSGKLPGKIRIFQLLMRAAQIGVKRQLLPNGAVPPLGDSPGGMQHRIKPLLGTLWSPTNGLAISSSESHYLSFTAGFRSVIHKQLDELSVSWWVDGNFILRDAGLLSYDQNDPIATMMRGHKGHSLPVYSNFDSWTTKNTISFGKNDSRLRGHLVEKKEEDELISFSGLLKFDGNAIIRRTVDLSPDKKLRIVDSFLSTKYGTPMSRFLLDPSISVISNDVDGNLVLRSRNRLISVIFESNDPGKQINVQINKSFVALEHYKSAETKEIIVSPTVPREGYELVATFTIR